MDLLNYLISQRANILEVDNNGDNIAHALLIEKHDDITALKESIEYLISLPEGAELLKMTNGWGRTPLFEWIASDNLPPDPETIRLILQNSEEDVNVTDTNGDTMFLAGSEKRDSLECLKCLKNDFGADHTAINKIGRNVLHISAHIGITELVMYFVSIEVSLELQDNDGDTPILLAAYSQHLDIVKYLVEQRGNVLAVNTNGNNIAHLLLGDEFIDTDALNAYVEYLLSLPQASEIFKMNNKWGRTPLHQWIASGNLSLGPETIERILQTSGEDVNGIDCNGNTMFLTAATKKNSLECLQCLKKVGADHNVANNHGYNALYFARSRAAKQEVVDYLISIECS